MCGFIGIYGHSKIVPEIYDGLLAVQHRGQDAAGICTFNGKFHLKKGSGLVRDIFNESSIQRLKGNIGIGHVRYPTLGSCSAENAHPFLIYHPFGISMCHNGNVTNFHQLVKKLSKESHRYINSTCDIEVILNIFADELTKQDIKELNFEHIVKAVEGVYDKVKGSYSTVGIIGNGSLIGFRDPYGIKPIIMGERKIGNKTDYAIASESVALDIYGFKDKRDIQPGEVVYIDEKGKLHSKRIIEKPHCPCIFEWIYFARPDSFIDKVGVYQTRIKLGKELAAQWKKLGLKADVVVPVPDSARPAAISFAHELNIPYREALVKNRYIGRTFIMPEQKERTLSVRRKLNTIWSELKGKNVIIIDDSIVRGTTSREIVKMIRDAGAEKVYFVSYSAPLKFPCIYGIDMSTKGEFIAKDHDPDQIARILGADKVIYQSVEAMKQAITETNPQLTTFCCACFEGVYPTGDITDEMFDAIEKDRKKHHKG